MGARSVFFARVIQAASPAAAVGSEPEVGILFAFHGTRVSMLAWVKGLQEIFLLFAACFCVYVLCENYTQCGESATVSTIVPIYRNIFIISLLTCAAQVGHID